MSAPVSRDDLMRYLDDELLPSDRVRVEAALRDSTELQRELAIFQAMQRDFRQLTFSPDVPGSVWERVNRRVARPAGWILVVVGAVVWLSYLAYLFLVSPGDPVEKLAVGTLVIGFLVLLGSVAMERFRDWQSDPYRDVQR